MEETRKESRIRLPALLSKIGNIVLLAVLGIWLVTSCNKENTDTFGCFALRAKEVVIYLPARAVCSRADHSSAPSQRHRNSNIYQERQCNSQTFVKVKPEIIKWF